MYGINASGEIVTRLTDRELFTSYGISINACLSARNKIEGTKFALRKETETDDLVLFKGRKIELNGAKHKGWEFMLSEWLERICRIERYRAQVSAGIPLFEVDV